MGGMGNWHCGVYQRHLKDHCTILSIGWRMSYGVNVFCVTIMRLVKAIIGISVEKKVPTYSQHRKS
jgi:hypothetical protein